MTNDRLIEKLNYLAHKCEKDNIHAAAILYSMIAAIQTDNLKMLADNVQIITRTEIYPDLDDAIEAKEAFDDLMNEFSWN
jgi:hypothetical protein